MRFLIIILTLSLVTSCVQNKQKEGKLQINTSKVILKNKVQGDINKAVIKKLNEPLIALAAFYSAMGGSRCDGEYCDLTTALQLGSQGSKIHKDLIKKYFPNDKVAETVLAQDCYLRRSGATSFSDYEFLTLIDKGDTIIVEYNLMSYHRGEHKWTKGPDSYLFKDNKFKKIKRNLWSFVEE